MFLLLCTLASGAEITLHQTTTGLLAVGPDGTEMTAREFATAVGDHQTLEARQAVYRPMRLATGLLAWGGVGAFAVGSVGGFVALLNGDPPIALGFGAVGAMGMLSFVGGGATYLASRSHLNDMDRWYTLEEAQAWVDKQAQADLLSSLVVVPTARGFDVVLGAEPLTTQAFAAQVGDLGTYRLCKAARVGLMMGGIGSFSIGGYAMLYGISGDGDATESMVGLVGGAGMVGIGAGMFVLRSVLDRPQLWYDQAEAQALIDQTGAASQRTDRPALQLAVAPALVPDVDRLAPGVGISGTW